MTGGALKIPLLPRLGEIHCHAERSEESTRKSPSPAWILRCAQNEKMSFFEFSHGFFRSGLRTQWRNPG